MADHDAVCAASGLTIGYTNIRVVLLAASEWPGSNGINGRYYPLGPALHASWNRDANRPVGWENDTTYRLIHDLFKESLSEGRQRSMPELLEQMPSGLTVRRVFAEPRRHPDSYQVQLGKAQPAPWVPTPKRVLRILKAGNLKAYASKIAYGLIKVQAPRPNAGLIPEEWYTKAKELLYKKGYHADRRKDVIYGDFLEVSPFSVELTLDDVRIALLSGGWPEVDKKASSIEKPIFEDEATWKLFDAAHGFEVLASDEGFLVFHCVNGEQAPDAKSLEHYCSRLRSQGVECRPTEYDEHGLAKGYIAVPGQLRSFTSLVMERQRRRLDKMSSRYKKDHYAQRRCTVTWGLIREDVWQSLLATNTSQGRHKDDDGTFDTTKNNIEKAFEFLVEKAREELTQKDHVLYFRTIEHKLDALPRNPVLELAVWNDLPNRIGLKWTFLHFAVLYAKGEISEAERKDALTAFAEFKHVQEVLAYLTHQWKLPHTGYQDRFYEITAKVYNDWARLANADQEKDR